MIKKNKSLQTNPQEQSKNISILIVDDDDSIRHMLSKLLEENGYSVYSADSGGNAIDIVKTQTVDLALLDYELPDCNGIALIRQLKEIHPLLLCIVITGYGTIERAVEAMQVGAWDFITKPITPNMLIEKLERVEQFYQLRKEHDVHRKVLDHNFQFNGLVGESAAMQPVYESILKAAESNLPVLIEGETGVGKEYIAEAIHLNSKRKDKPYIVMDCTATPESLIESTLFGSTKGAFTGSVERKGLLEAAHSGSLLLDEVGEIAIDIQPKLLRCLETKCFRPVGSTKESNSDFRIICSTNRDLLKLTKKGEFRSDLFYRISAQRIHVPPLRTRRSDIPLLAQHFIDEIVADNEREKMMFTPEAIHKLTHYDWPGNIRQLKFVIEAAFFNAQNNLIQSKDLQLEGMEEAPETEEMELSISDPFDQDFKSYREEAILRAEQIYLKSLLKKYDGDVRQSAKRAGLTREALYRVLSRCGLSPSEFRDSVTKK